MQQRLITRIAALEARTTEAPRTGVKIVIFEFRELPADHRGERHLVVTGPAAAAESSAGHCGFLVEERSGAPAETLAAFTPPDAGRVGTIVEIRVVPETPPGFIEWPQEARSEWLARWDQPIYFDPEVIR